MWTILRSQKALPDNADVEANFSLGNPRLKVAPMQLGWLPFDTPAQGTKVDFVQGIKTVAGSGDPIMGDGVAMHMYLANASMDKRAFVNADGELLIVPQQGTLDIWTEYGKLWVQPGEIVVIQRGQRFTVLLPDGASRGYIQEVWGSSFELPQLGPLGSNSLANPRDFLHPTAHYEIEKAEWEIVYKQGGKFFSSKQDHSPYDVVCWTGNYVRTLSGPTHPYRARRTDATICRCLISTTSPSSSTLAQSPSTTLIRRSTAA